MANMIGRQFGGYTITGMLGKGGMAAVYRARQESMGREVALKIIDPELLRESEFVKRFEREMRAIGMMSHAHILKVFDFGQQDGVFYMVMELLSGGSVAEMIGRGKRIPLPKVSQILTQVASALDYAHQKGVIHRDLKPQNILLDEAGNAFLVDFGIAKLVDEGGHLTQTGTVVGTPAYIAPEHWLGKPIDGRADTYALGVVVYEMLVNRLPFQTDTLYSMMKAHLNEVPPQLRLTRPDLPSGLEAVFNRALAKNPDQRYRTAGEFASDFAALVQGQSVAPRTTAPETPLDDKTVAMLTPAMGESKPPPLPVKPAVDNGMTSPMPAYDPNAHPPEEEDGMTRPMPMYGYNADPGSTQPMPAAPPRETSPVPAFRPPVPQPAMPAAPPKPAPRKLPLPLILGGAAVLVIAVLIVLLASGPRLSEAEQTATQVAMLALTASHTPAPTETSAATSTPEVIVAEHTPTSSNTPTITPTHTSTVTPTFTSTVTPTITVTPPASFTPTPTETALPTETPTETPDPGQTATAFVTATIRALTGDVNAMIRSGTEMIKPRGGELAHGLAPDNKVVEENLGFDLRNFVVEARFFNPYGDVGTGTGWDYGFFFRTEGANRGYRLIVRSKGDYALIVRDGDSRLVSNAPVENLDISATGSNFVRLAVKGKDGFLFVNGTYIATLDLSERQINGEISIVTGVLEGNKKVDAVTRYEGLTLWEVR
ncbi:MAG: protein kinase [Anaerolinea sp.]|nr:protein kinase [Anaerolinea sp.]